jgi:hypothetical protein
MAKLINYQYLRTEVDISQNVPDMELDSPIRRSQEMLSMILGEDLYNQLDGQHPNFTGANGALIPYVKKFLAWQAYQFWLPKANLKTHASGLRVHREENSDPATDRQMAELIKDAKSWAQTHKEKLIQYLEDNHDSFPLYEYNCGVNKRGGTSFHITAVGTKHKKGCTCYNCYRDGHS